MAHVLVIEGSRTDDKLTNVLLKVLKACNVLYRVDCTSAHWHAGDDYNDYIKRINEKIIVFIGGMSLVAPGIISATLRNMGRYDTIVIAIPTDQAARSAIEDLPMGTPVLTAGLNTVSVTHSITNSGLDIVKLVFMITKDSSVGKGLTAWFAKMKEEKPMAEIALDEEGLIPEQKKE